ncbi:hypothetical protein FS837_002074, partial [Tulasnella sp. UAMH 9824]
MNSMEQDDSYDSNSNRSARCDEGGAAGQFEPSVKLAEKMQKLAKWRIDPSLITFFKHPAELHGGHAMLWSPFNKSGELSEKIRIETLGRREAGFLVELSHANIIKLEGFVEDASKGIVWLVFPWEVNGNLRDFVATQDWEIPERISL